MIAELLLEHFHRLAEAPDAIPRLRQFILDLAVRGKLVEQDPKDEPASELLKRSLQEDVSSHLKKNKTWEALRLAEDCCPFRIPTNWEWTRLGHIGAWGSGSTPPRGAHELFGGGVTWLKSGELNDNQYLTGSEETITELAVEKGSFRMNRPGDVLIAMYGATIGKLAILADSAVTNQAVCGCTPFSGLINRYLFLYLLSQRASFRASSEGGAQPNISRIKIVNFEFPLPPLAEQHRIVAKVDELMAVCNGLAAAQTERETRRDRLVAASLHRLRNGEDADDFREHARFHLRHLRRLTSRPEHIAQLRQTILNLAILGRLVARDPTDEPASELLRRINRSRKQRRTNENEIQDADSPLPMLPQSWIWTTVDTIAADVANAITDGPFGANLKTSHYVREPGFRVVRLQNIGRGTFRNEHRAYIDASRYQSLSKHRVYAGDLVIAGLVDPLIRCCEVPEDIGPAIVKADCYRLAVHPDVSSRYVRYYLNSTFAGEFAAIHHHGMTLTRIGLGNFRSLPIALPPFSEQTRIVAKIEELFVLCDRMQALLTVSQLEATRIISAVLDQLLDAPCTASSANKNRCENFRAGQL